MRLAQLRRDRAEIIQEWDNDREYRRCFTSAIKRMPPWAFNMKMPREEVGYLLNWYNYYSKYPTRKEKNILAEATGIPAERIASWFARERAKERKRRSGVIGRQHRSRKVTP